MRSFFYAYQLAAKYAPLRNNCGAPVFVSQVLDLISAGGLLNSRAKGLENSVTF